MGRGGWQCWERNNISSVTEGQWKLFQHPKSYLKNLAVLGNHLHINRTHPPYIKTYAVSHSGIKAQTDNPSQTARIDEQSQDQGLGITSMYFLLSGGLSGYLSLPELEWIWLLLIQQAPQQTATLPFLSWCGQLLTNKPLLNQCSEPAVKTWTWILTLPAFI